jgi:hypothetical protein
MQQVKFAVRQNGLSGMAKPSAMPRGRSQAKAQFSELERRRHLVAARRAEQDLMLRTSAAHI